MFDYDVLTKEVAEQERFNLIPEGRYKANIKDVKAEISKNSGNPMFVMLCDIFENNGHPCEVKDFLTFTPKMMWKVINAAEATGLLKEYESKKLRPEMMMNKMVLVDVSIQRGNEIPVDKLNGKAPGALYPDQNRILNYYPLEESFSALEPKKPVVSPGVEPGFDDDVPF